MCNCILSCPEKNVELNLKFVGWQDSLHFKS